MSQLTVKPPSSLQFPVFGQVNNFIEGLKTLPALSEYVESVSLVGNNVFALFIESKVETFFWKITRIETKIEVYKRELISLTKGLDCTDLLNLLERISQEDMEKIGPDFFYVTSKRLAKNQSIENYSKFIHVLFKNFNFNSNFIKNFFCNDRDSDEVEALIRYISQYKEDGLKTERSVILAKSLFICLEKLSLKHKYSDVFHLLEKNQSIIANIKNTKLTKSMSKAMLSILQSALHKNDYEGFKRAVIFFKEVNFEFNDFYCNKILDLISKALSDNSVLLFFIDFMKEIQIVWNTVTYNTIMDYYASTRNLDKVIEIFESMKNSGVQIDNYTFSIMIKAIKASREPPLDLVNKVFEQYKAQNDNNDNIIFNNFMDLYIQLGEYQRAKNIYMDLIESNKLVPDQITFNTLIKGACKGKDLPMALDFYRDMKRHSLKPNRITYNSLMDLAVKLQDIFQALEFLDEMQKDDITADGYTYSIILNGLKVSNSNPDLVKSSLDNIAKVIENGEFKLDEVFFNSILDVCSKYDLFTQMEFFYNIMREKKISESSVTYGILIKAYGKGNDFEKVQNIFEKMIQSSMPINEVTYGCVLDACAKSGKMSIALKIFESLKNSNVNMNSIVFTTIIKGYINSQSYNEAIKFFNEIKHYVDLPGMIITYNCALDLYVRKGDIANASILFKEIEKLYGADLISYSTIIKGLCQAEKKNEALEYIKKMMTTNVETDISVVNLFLDSCATVNDYKLGITGYQYVMMKNITPNEITFGIMIKIYGFAKELQKAFDLLDLMAAYEIIPSIIIYTNLIHISFYNKNPKKAEQAFLLFKKQGLKGDRLMYSKLIEGLIRFRETSKLLKYVEDALEDRCTLKPEVIEQLEEIYYDDEYAMEKLREVRNIKHVERKDHNADRYKNKYNQQNPQKYKQQIYEKNREQREKEESMKQESIRQESFKMDRNSKPKREGINVKEALKSFKEENRSQKDDMSDRESHSDKKSVKKDPFKNRDKPFAERKLFKEREVPKDFAQSEHKSEYSKHNSVKKPATLFNFRQNPKKTE